MPTLLAMFVDLARLRGHPGSLPASATLTVLLALLYAAASALQSLLAYGGEHLLGRTLVDLGFTLALVWLLLAVARRAHRYGQTVSAVLGTSVLLTPVMLLLLSLRGAAEAAPWVALLLWAGSVALIVWYTLIVAHILRAALETGFVTSLALAFTYLVAGTALVTGLYPEPA